MKSCKVCSEEKELTDFPVKGRWYANRCKSCTASWNKEYYERNRAELLAQKAEYTQRTKEQRAEYVTRNAEYYREKNRQWYKDNSEKNRIRQHQRRLNLFSVSKDDFPVDILPRLVEFYGTNCLNPNCKTPGEKPTLDHIVPLHKGGVHGLENFQVLCGPCNSSKGAWHSTDYRAGLVYEWHPTLGSNNDGYPDREAVS